MRLRPKIPGVFPGTPTGHLSGESPPPSWMRFQAYVLLVLFCYQAGMLAQASQVLETARGALSVHRVPGAGRRVPAGHAVRSLWEGGRARAQQGTEGARTVFLPLLHSLELHGYKFGVRGAGGTSRVPIVQTHF